MFAVNSEYVYQLMTVILLYFILGRQMDTCTNTQFLKEEIPFMVWCNAVVTAASSNMNG